MISRGACASAVLVLIFSADLGFSQGYGGPSMLSRGGNRPGQRGRAPADISVYGGTRATAETGLTPIRLQGDGLVANDKRYGVQAEIGAYGTHSWRKTSLGLDYRGDYRHTTQRGYNGINQALSLSVTSAVTSRTQVFFQETGGINNRAFGGFAAPASSSPSSLNLANNELFDARMYFSQTSAGVAYRTSARMTYVLNGTYFFTKRPDARLVSATGYGAGAAVSYRLNSRSTVGMQYQHLQFNFRRVFGGSDIDGAAVSYSRMLTRNIDLSLTGGMMFVRTTGTRRVELSEEVAAILGRSTGVAAFRRQDWVPQGGVQIGYTLERSRFDAQYMSAVNPGNGVFLTSQRQELSAGYSFTGIRKLSFGASARYARSRSLALALRDMTTIGGGVGANYSLTRMVNLSSQFDYRTFRTTVQGREGFFIAVGLTVSPARVPLSIW